MQTDRSRKQVPQVPESEEMSSSTSPEPEPSSPQREKQHHQEDRIPRTMNNYKKLITFSDNNLLFDHVLKCYSAIEEGFSIYAPMPSFLNPHLMEQDNQYSFGAIEIKSGENQLLDVKYRRSATTHTERVSCTNIDETLQRCRTEVKNMYMFTLYSPCLMRGHKIDKKDKDKEPCMLHLLEKAYQWYSEFGIKTRVFFKKPWGLSGPDIFKGLLYSDVSRTSSAFHPYVDLCKEHRFKLDNKFRQDNKAIFRLIGKVNRKETLKKRIKSTLRKLQEKAKEGLKKCQHLKRGLRYIDSLKFPKKVHKQIIKTFKNNWKTLVNHSSMSLIIEKITSDFNNAEVKLFVRDLRLDLGDSGYFQINQVPPGAEVEEGDYVQVMNTSF
ncbi:uncharacterized protein LOC117556023 [Gymnodraco acuticeps]|uniref:Uncharacterized protein LOC117556023 n=1 Tax=Gymnodraco acuticeps TaxID=8218 RepID=A0A6P8VKM0_GYMAC|nr:uncharacterized protein LOC117556023 [Gymnodraco acuticeps]